MCEYHYTRKGWCSRIFRPIQRKYMTLTLTILHCQHCFGRITRIQPIPWCFQRCSCRCRLSAVTSRASGLGWPGACSLLRNPIYGIEGETDVNHCEICGFENMFYITPFRISSPFPAVVSGMSTLVIHNFAPGFQRRHMSSWTSMLAQLETTSRYYIQSCTASHACAIEAVFP